MQFDQTLSACIVTYNNADKISTVVSSIRSYTNDVDYKLYISDNGSSDSTVDNALAADKDAVVLKNGSNLGFGNRNIMPLSIRILRLKAMFCPPFAGILTSTAML